MQLKLIVGIGNPGKKYEYNRHNVGFLILDSFAQKHKLAFNPSKGNYYYFVQSEIANNNFLLVKPTTFVNNSGLPIKDILASYSISPNELLVVYDDINIQIGTYKVNPFGGSGGHNGIKSIIYQIESENFARIRIGIGNSSKPQSLSKYVLDNFTDDEFEKLNGIIDNIHLLMENFIVGGVKKMLDTQSTIVTNNKKNNNSQIN